MLLQDFLQSTSQSVADFAGRARLSQQAIYKILSGERKSPRRSTVIKITQATSGKVTANDLYDIKSNGRSKKNEKEQRP